MHCTHFKLKHLNGNMALESLLLNTLLPPVQAKIILKLQQKELILFQVGKIIKHKILLVIQLMYVR